MMDEMFEKGLINFIVLTVATIVLCVILDLIVRKRFSSKRNKDGATANTYLSGTMRFLIWIAGSQIVLRQIKPLQTLGTTIMGASSILAAAFSFAAQSSFANYIGGFSLVTSQPFRVGDAIYLKDRRIAGIVKDISFRHTTIETKTGTVISIPNSSMNQEMVEDLTNGGYAREVEFRVGPDTDTARLQVIIKDALSSCPLCLDTEIPHMEVESFSADGYTISFVIRTANMHEYIKAKNEVLPALYTMLRENGITVV